MSFNTQLLAHLQTGSTTLCRAWAVTRTDGEIFGFTDHDRTLSFDGITFRADCGLSALALQQATGLAVDNTEVLGALCDASICEADIEAGRFDGAEVTAWLVNWADVASRQLQFRGTLGDLRRVGGAFHAELRGLTQLLNRPLGRVYQKPCPAVLGDGTCRFDLTQPGYCSERPVETVQECRIFEFASFTDFEPGWFERGTAEGLSGDFTGLKAGIKRDYIKGDLRVIELWEPLRASVVVGDMLRLTAGCDKRFETCRLKFNNLLNFQGFPDIPGDDWMAVQPVQSGLRTAGSRR